jgi:hypothetical protein
MFVLLFAAACLLLTPGAALAGKNRARQKQANKITHQTSGCVTASTTSQSRNGRGIGKGGVPAMRDRINERLCSLDQAVADLDGRTTTLEGAVSAIDTQLQGLDAQVQALSSQVQSIDAVVQNLGTLLMELDERVAFLEGLTVDEDLDGFPEIHDDCDDANPDVFPGATEILGNGIDDDCDGFVDEMT